MASNPSKSQIWSGRTWACMPPQHAPFRWICGLSLHVPVFDRILPFCRPENCGGATAPPPEPLTIDTSAFWSVRPPHNNKGTAPFGPGRHVSTHSAARRSAAHTHLLQELRVEVVEGVVAQQHEGLRRVQLRVLVSGPFPGSLIAAGSLRSGHLKQTQTHTHIHIHTETQPFSAVNAN